MEAKNQPERTTSLINFIILYVLILALPLFVAYMAGARRHAGIGTATDVEEQKKLAENMKGIQDYMAQMRNQDAQLDQMGNASPESGGRWLNDAKRQKNQFEIARNSFCNSSGFTDARQIVQSSACTYLDELLRQRGNYLLRVERQLSIQNQNLSIQQLKDKNDQLQAANVGLQNQINTLNALIAKSNNSGGAGQQDASAVVDLRWQLRFKDADCNKKQADLLADYNEAARRKQLYTAAKANFQQIAQLARNNYMLQQSASEKIREINQTMRQL